jgi:hypothetical protein
VHAAITMAAEKEIDRLPRSWLQPGRTVRGKTAKKSSQENRRKS